MGNFKPWTLDGFMGEKEGMTEGPRTDMEGVPWG